MIYYPWDSRRDVQCGNSLKQKSYSANTLIRTNNNIKALLTFQYKLQTNRVKGVQRPAAFVIVCFCFCEFRTVSYSGSCAEHIVDFAQSMLVFVLPLMVQTDKNCRTKIEVNKLSGLNQNDQNRALIKVEGANLPRTKNAGTQKPSQFLCGGVNYEEGAAKEKRRRTFVFTSGLLLLPWQLSATPSNADMMTHVIAIFCK